MDSRQRHSGMTGRTNDIAASRRRLDVQKFGSSAFIACFRPWFQALLPFLQWKDEWQKARKTL
jgi:hypothetical protein